LQRDIQSTLNEEMIGRTVDVLVDASSRRRDNELSGRTSTNVPVNLPGPIEWIGRTLPVRIERAGPHSVWGRTMVGGTGVPG
jgi:tRNA-2-methylthio-N6-dimethylallyladenosine synthase